MAASQFTIYSSTDTGGPGMLTGQAGSLISLLNAILIDGYSGKPAGGGSAWSHPVATASNIGTYRASTGARMTLLVNDNGPNGTSTYKEAWVTGWETCSGVGAPVGTGVGQFPTAAQLLTTGHAVVRKSVTADAVGRHWIAFADAVTFYLFIQAEGTAVYNGNLLFGDIFSFFGTADTFRCALVSGAVENNTQLASNTANNTDQIFTFAVTGPNCVGKYMPRSFGLTAGAIQVISLGDFSRSVGTTSTTPMAGAIQTPNGPDNSLYMCAINVGELVNLVVRGRFRGIYQVCHPLAQFVDGQILYGANDFAGKTFQIVKPGANTGFWAIETSATVETN